MALFSDTQDYNPLDKFSAVSVAAGDHLSLPEELIYGGVAAVADFGSTIWNSLTPEKYNTTTQDMLSGINKDALQVYNEHPDAVRTASFVGGMFAPIGLSMKVMGGLRSGFKGMSYFSEASSASRLAAAEKAFAEAGPTNAAFQAAQWSMYRGIAANAVADSVAAEMAIYASMNTHPFMEDYKKDIATNFMISTAIGGAIGSGIGSIIAKGTLSKATAEIEKPGVAALLKTLRQPEIDASISEISHVGETLIVKDAAITNLRALISDAEKGVGDVTYAPYVLESLKATATAEEAGMYRRLIAASKGDLTTFIETAPIEQKKFILDFATRIENAGLDKISFAQVSENALAKSGSGLLHDTVSLFTRSISADGREVIEKTDAYWSPVFKAYFGKSDSVNYLTIADLNKTITEFEKSAKKANISFPRADATIEREIAHSAVVDADYAEMVLALSTKTKAEIEKLKVHPDDLSMLKAIYVRAKELGAEDIKISITKEAPSYAVKERQILARNGIDPDYGNKLRAMEKDWGDYSLYNHGRAMVGAVSTQAESALASWVNGSYGFLRNGASFQRGLAADIIRNLEADTHKKLEMGSRILSEIKNSAPSQRLREALGKIADADGNVWLYRGMNKEPKSHKPVESYTILPEKAAEFGKGYDKAVKLYKVHVDDIIGTVRDFGPTGKKPEILAFPPTRDFQDIAKTNLRNIPGQIVMQDTGQVITQAKSVEVVEGLINLDMQMQQSMANAVKGLQLQDFGMEAIALRTGTPVDTIKQMMSGGSSLNVPSGGLIKYGSKLDIENALHTEQRSLGLSTTTAKVPYAEMLANLDRAGLEAVSKNMVIMNMISSPSSVVQQLSGKFLSADIRILSDRLMTALPEFVSSRMKTTMWSSANQVLADMPEIAAIATVLGKETIALKNFVKETFEAPIATAMGKILKDGAAQIEANTALNLNAGLSGHRFYKARQFWQLSDGVDKKILSELMGMEDTSFVKAMATPIKEGSAMPIGQAATFRGKAFSVISDDVNELMNKFQEYGRHMYEMKNSYTKAIGRGSISDIGFWTPAVNVSNKEIAYVHDIAHDKTTMLFAKTPEELNAGIADYRKAMERQGLTVKVVTKDQQQDFNLLAGRHDPMYMEIADLSMRHGGSSAKTFVATDASEFQEILSGYGNYVNRNIDDLVQLQLSPVLDHLKNLSDISQTGYNVSKGNMLQKITNKPADPGQVLRNIVLGYPNISQHQGWSELQQRGQVATDMLLKGITDLFSPVVGKQVRTAEQWTQITKDMEARGILNPFESLDKEFAMGRYLAEGKPGTEALTPRAISLFNGLAATTLLRFMELGQPLVNAISLPILTSGAINKKMAASFMGTAVDPDAKFTVSKVMMNAVRLMNHPTEGKFWSEIGESKNLFSAELRNVTEIMEHARSLDPGIMKKTEDIMESSFVKLLSRPSDYSESMVRKVSFFNGVTIAKEAYPGLGKEGVVTFARAFMDEAVGNYTAAQRPAFFQGTFGVGFGLFQTYMLTLAQQVYRGVQNRDWAALGKQLLTQGTLFGGTSLPGFHQVSQMIGTHFSDQHIDLETGIYRAIPDPTAKTILYGLPANLGLGITTRGDIQPRLPNPFTGISSVAAANIVTQAYTAGERVAHAAFTVDENAGRALLEALSLQSVSRPIARLSEIASGTSLTGAGNVVASGTEIYNTQSIFARMFATRPIEEIKVREAMQLDTLYKASDSDKRKEVTKRLKSHVRAGQLDYDTLEKLSGEYMRTGSPSGWRSAVNESLMQESGVGGDSVKRKLGPTNPLNMMIEDLD